MKFIGAFITEDLPGGEDVWKVHEMFWFLDSQDVEHSVPDGFITDGGSIPAILWPIVGHPRSTKAGQAYALHDMLYREGYTTRARADQILYEGVTVLGANWFQRQAVLRGLQVGGWVTGNRYRNRKIIHTDP